MQLQFIDNYSWAIYGNTPKLLNDRRCVLTAHDLPVNSVEDIDSFIEGLKKLREEYIKVTAKQIL